MSKIVALRAQEILDSRGWPTLSAEVELEDGSVGWAAVPSGASTGEHEAVELRDGDKARYLGKGVLRACANATNDIFSALKGFNGELSVLDEKLIALDGTPNKARLGANATLAVSLAAARARAASSRLPLYKYLRKAYGLADEGWLLPSPMLNVVNGGKHADSGLDVQEFMIVPVSAPSFREALRAGAEIYQRLKKALASRGLTTAVGDEGGFAPKIKTHIEVLELLTGVIVEAGYEGKTRLALDCAASEYYRENRYVLEGKSLTATDAIAVYAGWAERYGIISIEDPLAEDDWTGWAAATARLGGRTRIVGDDLFVTNPRRLQRGIADKSANAILIKLNQIGTLTETITAVRQAQAAGFSTIISHRSGETEDAFIADLAVALNAGAIKTGAPCRSERLAKYNRLLQIENELGSKAAYAGASAFSARVFAQ